MRKLKLEMDDLAVESFTVDESQRVRGTVAGMTGATACDTGGCGGYCQSSPLSCGCNTNAGCIFPTDSCGPTETFDQFTCHCQYPNTDYHVCCGGPSADCSGGAMC
jgi:hypothetical protein